jgi:DnaK suppressor protein
VGIDAAHARARLVEEQVRLRAEFDAEDLELPEQMTYGSQAAAATQVSDQNRTQALRERAARDLALVEAALRRLDAGIYGRCEACGRQIDPARLEALPWAARDVECQRQVRKG